MENLRDFLRLLEQDQIAFFRDEPLDRHTTFRIGGPCRVYCRPDSVCKTARVLQLCRQFGIRFYILGKGSNTLFSDEGFAGAVVSLEDAVSAIRVQGDTVVAGAGAALHQLCRTAQEHALSGLEFAYGIPGSVGGAVYMNAGAYGGEMKDVLQEVSCLDEEGHLRTAEAKDLQLGYRTSVFEKKAWCILEAVVRLHPGDPEEIRRKMEELLARRKEKQPLEYPSAGSTFKRPQGAFAAALIEQCGLKGMRVGGAQVSEKHSGFVINTGGATCRDVVELTRQIREIVQEKTGFVLEREIRVVE